MAVPQWPYHRDRIPGERRARAPSPASRRIQGLSAVPKKLTTAALNSR